MRIAVAIIVLSLAACGPAQAPGYPPQVELNFRNACEAQSPPAGLCACVWGKIAAEVPPADLIALERLPINERGDHPLTQQINGYALACGVEGEGASSP